MVARIKRMFRLGINVFKFMICTVVKANLGRQNNDLRELDTQDWMGSKRI